MDLIRQRSIASVIAGKQTPEEADARCRANGLGPLLPEPDPALFNPLDEPFWSLTMTVAWVAWREIDAVRVCWDKYCMAFQEWVRLPKASESEPQRWALGHHIPRPVSLLIALDEVTFRPIATLDPPLFPIVESWKALQLALSVTPLRAYAYSIKEGSDRWIDGPEWPKLSPGELEGEPESPLEALKRNGEPLYRDIRISAAAVLVAWPVNAVGSDPADASRNPRAGGMNAQAAAKVVSECIDWLVDNYMAKSKLHQTHTQDQLYPLAVAEFGALMTERAFKRRVWPAAVERGYPLWSGGGTPPSRTKH